MKKELIRFLSNIHSRSYSLRGMPSDFITVNAFKDHKEIVVPAPPLDVVKMDQGGHVGALCDWINNLKRDGKRTALYDSIYVSSAIISSISKQLRNRYLKVVLAITDGEDNDSQKRIKELEYFNNSDLHLAVVGVGSSTNRELKNLSRLATSTHSIYRFEDLYNAITVSISTIIEKKQFFSI